MRKLIFVLFLVIPLLGYSQATITCFSTPDGTDRPWALGWSYKQYIIPDGYRIDSVYGGFTRPTFPVYDDDYIFAICEGTTTFDTSTAIGFNIATTTQPFNYSLIDTSMYNVWYNLTSFNYISTGVVQVYLPTNDGAIWNSLCIAISPDIAMGIDFEPPVKPEEITFPKDKIRAVSLFDINGRMISKTETDPFNIPLNNLSDGVYIMSTTYDSTIVNKKIFLKN
jgi:hypothetical protein